MPKSESTQYDNIVQVPPLDGETSLEGSLESAPTRTRTVFVEPPRSLRQKLKPYLFGLGALVLLTVSGYIFLQRNQRPSLISTGDFSTIKVPLDKISSSSSTLNTAKSLDINGQLRVSEAIVLSPITKPTVAATGQLLFDKSLGGLTYYNGSQFIPVGGSSTTLVTNSSITNLTNLTNVTNVYGSNLSAQNGTPGTLAMFTGTDTLGDSFINQSGDTLRVGSSLASSTTNIQGGNGIAINSNASALSLEGGAINIVGTANTSGPGATISITSGASTTTASGDINIDTGSGIIDGELITSKTFESGLDGMSNWFNTVLETSSEQARTGTQSLKVTRTSPFWGMGEVQGGTNGTPVVPGHQYYVSAWLRAGATPGPFSMVLLWENGVVGSTQSSPITDNTTGWTELSIVATAPAGATKMFIQSSGVGGSVGEVHYWDDITITDLSSASSASSITLGTTNAKFVSIGNINQIGATSITGGGGINLNAGVSNMNMTAGVFNLTGSAASVLSTTAGALTITSSTAATWGIANASTGVGGNLTLKAGDSAWDSDGGDLVLQGGAGSGIGIGGAVIIRPREDSAIAFQIQDSTGANPLLTANTSDMVLAVSGTTTKFATLMLDNAHFGVNQANAPTIATPTNCGTSPSAVITPASADSAGSFTITTGTDGTSATCDTTIAFNKAFADPPKSILVVGKADAASAARQIYVVSASTTSFSISFGTSTAGSNSTTYSFSYWVIE